MRLPASSGLNIPFLLGVVPLTAGLSIFLVWLATDWKWLPLIGIATLYLSFGSVLAGLAWLGVWILKMRRSRDRPRAGLTRQTIVVAAVLVVNFPVAGGILWTAHSLATRYTVTIRNRSSAAIQSAALNGGGVSLEIGRIAPGGRITEKFHIVHDGTLVFSWEQSDRKLQVIVDDYVTKGWGGHKQIDVSTAGLIEVQSNTR